MSLLVLDRVRSVQPGPGARVNWRNPIARGLCWAQDFSVGPVGGKTLVGASPTWTSSGASKSVTSGGRGTTHTTSGYLSAGSVPWDRITDIAWGFTSLVVATYLAKTTTSAFIAGDISINAGGAYNWGHYFGNATNSYNFYVKNGSGSVASTSEASVFVAGNVYAVVGCFDSAESKIKHAWNGRGVVSQAQTGSVYQPGLGGETLAYNRWGDTSYVSWNIHAHLVWRRALKDAELISVTRNPWQLFL